MRVIQFFELILRDQRVKDANMLLLSALSETENGAVFLNLSALSHVVYMSEAPVVML